MCVLCTPTFDGMNAFTVPENWFIHWYACLIIAYFIMNIHVTTDASLCICNARMGDSFSEKTDCLYHGAESTSAWVNMARAGRCANKCWWEWVLCRGTWHPGSDLYQGGEERIHTSQKWSHFGNDSAPKPYKHIDFLIWGSVMFGFFLLILLGVAIKDLSLLRNIRMLLLKDKKPGCRDNVHS